MKMLLAVTGYQADAMFAVQNTSATVEFDTVDIEHGTDPEALYEIGATIRDFVESTEAVGVEALAYEAKLYAEVAAVIRNAHDGDPDLKITFKANSVDESCYKTELWIGPAE